MALYQRSVTGGSSIVKVAVDEGREVLPSLVLKFLQNL